MMLIIRSILFNILFYLTTLLQMIVMSPYFFAVSRKKAWLVPNNWARINNWLMKVVAGADIEFRGLEHIPDGACIIAPKHQSSWDTFAFVHHMRDPVYILKRQLMWIPLFGWYLGKFDMIAIDRASREEARKQVNEGARRMVANGRQIVIYPEGTRRPPGAEPAYKQGVAMIYEATGVPVIGVAHNAGLYWPRRKFLRYPGKMIIEFLPAIPAGLPKDEMFRQLTDTLEARSDALLLEAANAPNPPPMPESAARRLAELRAKV
jgi:1-acyl-sn-glycerol-3-phosphate acyltransferase